MIIIPVRMFWRIPICVPPPFITVMFEFTFQVLITIVSFGDLQFLTHGLILNFIFPIKAAINIGLSYNIFSAKLKNSKSSFISKSNFCKPEEKQCVLNHSSKIHWCSWILKLLFHSSLFPVVIFCSSWNYSLKLISKLHSFLTWTPFLVTNDILLQFSPFSFAFMSARNGLRMSLWDPLLSIQQVWLLCNLWISLLICWKCYSTEMQVVKNLPWVSFYMEYFQKRQNFFSTTWNKPNVCFALFIFLHRKIIQQFPSTVSVFKYYGNPFTCSISVSPI